MKKLIKTIGLAIMLSICAASNAFSVNVNTATQEELSAALYRVGPVTAARIVNERQNGPFKDEMDLQNRVMGIGPRLIEQNRMNIQFTDEAAAQTSPGETPVINPTTGEPMATGTTTPMTPGTPTQPQQPQTQQPDTQQTQTQQPQTQQPTTQQPQTQQPTTQQ